ncbi:MAG TPA: hydroxymethylbilane synthase [Longimicrobiaceae bacterium]|nr:hydroxymethylbilane synthase [Longimicrobiaceae bacterium]
MTESVRIASRGSELALWQANSVRDALLAVHPELGVEIRVIHTTGDRITDVPLARIGDRGLFTKEIDATLLNGQADLAVHSLKDVPTILPEGLDLAAVTERTDPRDVVLARPGGAASVAAFPPGARVGTSSLRRRAQLRALRPDVEVVDLRGNLNTRLAKLDRGEYDAIVLAAAGVLRLGWRDRVSAWLDPDQWLPAVGQGALALVVRAGDEHLRQLLGPLHHRATAAAVGAERAFLNGLEGGCQVPIGALATCGDRSVRLAGLVADLEGVRVLRLTAEGPIDSPERVGERLADDMIRAGADRILADVRSHGTPPPPAP